MSNYSIKDLEKLSGIKAHTLRVWEQRYGILKPERTDSNIRLYNNEEMKSLLNIAILNNNGYKISKIAELSEQEIANEVNRLSEFDQRPSTQIDQLIIAMVEIDEDRFEKTLSGIILKLGFEKTISEVLYPYLKRIGVMWQTGAINPAQEHFITNLIRQKLIVAIDSQHVSFNNLQDSFLLFLPEGELHEISLLFCSFLLKSRNKKVVYLGQSVPFNDIERIAAIRNPKYLLTILTYQLLEINTQEYLNNIAEKFPDKIIFVSGFQTMNPTLQIPSNVRIFKDPTELIQLLSELKN